jgi:bifunctional non-homologous end joining protein LigD
MAMTRAKSRGLRPRPLPGTGSSLAEYRRKRDFTRTAEPPARRGKPQKHPIFVIQEHHARRLHYDFRLEADGVLQSWAVTKTPTLDPDVRRLAVRTEDHPMEYAKFHGRIPEGQYGAGQVNIWDHGTYQNLSDMPMRQALEQGKLSIELHGRKLKGRFALVRMGNGRRENWLLIKKHDEFAVAGAGERDGQPAAAPAAIAVPVAKARGSRAALPAELKFTHLDKVMFPEKEYTKGDVLLYYAKIADKLIPHLRDRPMTLERMPDGVKPGAPLFWQKRTPAYYPKWIPRVDIASEGGSRVNYALVNDAETLLYMVNQGAITFHPWLSRVQSPDRPDHVLFDLDRGDRSFADLVRIARELYKELERQDVRSCLKTTGKTGLHVVVPWRRKGGFDEARHWAMEIAQRVERALPEIATTQRAKAARDGRAYVDVMQNFRGKHMVPPYVLRPVAAATVSTPLKWAELDTKLDPAKFDLKTALQRFERQRTDPMAALTVFA